MPDKTTSNTIEDIPQAEGGRLGPSKKSLLKHIRGSLNVHALGVLLAVIIGIVSLILGVHNQVTIQRLDHEVTQLRHQISLQPTVSPSPVPFLEISTPPPETPRSLPETSPLPATSVPKVDTDPTPPEPNCPMISRGSCSFGSSTGILGTFPNRFATCRTNPVALDLLEDVFCIIRPDQEMPTIATLIPFDDDDRMWRCKCDVLESRNFLQDNIVGFVCEMLEKRCD